MEINDLWVAYKKGRSIDVSLRNELVEHYLHVVREAAESVYAKLSNKVDIEDLVSDGVFGLMEAIDRFDLEQGVNRMERPTWQACGLEGSH